MNIKGVIGKIRDPLSLISDVSQVFQTLYTICLSIIVFYDKPFIKEVKIAVLSLHPLFKFFLLLLLFISLYQLLRRMRDNAIFIIDSSKFNGIFNVTDKSSGLNLLIDDYDKIIPPTSVVKGIYEEFYSRAKKWKHDIYLADSELNIDISKENVKITMTCDFFSKIKQATIQFSSLNLKIPKEKKIRVEQLKYDSYRVKLSPFFQDKRWRKFVKESLERSEHEIAGREIYLSIGSWVTASARLLINPHFVPLKIYSFFLKDGEMYSDVLATKPIATF